jgi:hypothetical protein
MFCNQDTWITIIPASDRLIRTVIIVKMRFTVKFNAAQDNEQGAAYKNTFPLPARPFPGAFQAFFNCFLELWHKTNFVLN